MADPRIASAAGDLLRNDAFRAACEALEKKYDLDWKRSDYGENERREEMYRRFRALVDLLRELKGFWDTAEAERILAERKRTLAERDLSISTG